jgi:thiamine-phosphate pyrophosphorylase
MIQLREKDLSAAELYPLARDLRLLTQDYGSLLLINDRVDLALAIDADGVHLGQHSLPIEAARTLLGKQKIIGVSTHSLAEVNMAQKQGADFVTYGPVYYTPSKAAYGDPVGVTALKLSCQQCRNLPVYALGGLKPNNVLDTLQTGAYGIAVISALLAEPSPVLAYQKLTREIQKVN